MRVTLPEKILKRLSLVRADVYKMMVDAANSNAKLSADLVTECQRMRDENDQLAKENESLVDILRDIRGLVDKALDLMG